MEPPALSRPERTISVAELTPHLVCTLCGGYYVDATTIVECLHTFCRSCILRHLQKTRCCPAATCDVMIHRTKSGPSLRPDTTLQSIVYKTVPGLHREEMRRRQRFCRDKPDAGPDSAPASSGLSDEDDVHFFEPDDTIDVRMQYASPSPDDVVPVRFLRCPAGLPLTVLRKFLYRKYQFPEHLQMELIHGRKVLPQDIKLLDVAYMVSWSRKSPLKLLFRLKSTKTSNKRPASAPTLAQNKPAKIRRLNPDSARPSESSREDPGPTGGAGPTQRPPGPPRRAAANGQRRCNTPNTGRKGSGGKVGIGRETSTALYGAEAAKAKASTPTQQRVVQKRSLSGSATRQETKCKPKHLTVTSGAKVGDTKELAVTTVMENTITNWHPQNIVPNHKDGAKPVVPVERHTSKPKVTTALSGQRQSTGPTVSPGEPTTRTDRRPSAPANSLTAGSTADRERAAPLPGEAARGTAAAPERSPADHRDQSVARRAGELPTQGGGKPTPDERPQTPNQRGEGKTAQPDDTTAQASANPKVKPTQTPKDGLNVDCCSKLSNDGNAGKKARAFSAANGSEVSCPRKLPQGSRNNSSVAGFVPKPAVSKVDCSVQTVPVHVMKAKCNIARPAATSQGTNTLLSSPPKSHAKKALTPNGAAQEAKDFGEKALQTSASQAVSISDHRRVEAASNGPRPVTFKDSKPMFLSSGSKRPQGSNKIMSIVESLTQKNLSSLARRGPDVKIKQPPKEINGAGTASLSRSQSSSEPNGASPRATPPPAPNKASPAGAGGQFVVPAPLPARTSAGATAALSVSSPLHIETGSLGLRYSSAVPPLAGLSRPPASSSSSRPVFPVLPLPQRPKSQGVRSIPNPSLVRQRSAEERARDGGKGSPTAGSTAPAMSPPSIVRDIHSLTRQLQEAGTSVTVTDAR